MRRLTAAAVMLLSAASIAMAQDVKPAIFIPPTGDGFDIYIAAAMTKKSVPATVVTSADHARLTLKAAPVQVQRDSTRMKVAKCFLQSCANTQDKASVSVQLVDHNGAVVWSYAVDNDDSSKKDMAEAIAKRLKRDYFRQ
jgi:TolB-like protein